MGILGEYDCCIQTDIERKKLKESMKRYFFKINLGILGKRSG